MQHIPGYHGHVHGLAPENLHGKNYARTTATAINKSQKGYRSTQHVKGKDTFTSINRKEFSPNNFRRYIARPDMKGEKDYNDYTKSINEEMYESKNKILQSSNPALTDTICSKTGNSFFSMRKNMGQARYSMTADSYAEEAELKPKLLENRVVNQKGFFNLSNGFQKVFANDKKDKKMHIPIAGYCGHQRGEKSQNYFGRTFRDSAMQSKKLERQLSRAR